MEISISPVLLVEDDPNDVILMQRACRKSNLVNSLEVVTDGEAAIAYLDGVSPYDDRNRYPLPVLVLLDLKLPKKSGFEVLDWLQRQPKVGRTPVVVLTSSDGTPDVNRAFDLGANSYLVKPVAFADLVKLVQALDRYWLILNEKPEVA